MGGNLSVPGGSAPLLILDATKPGLAPRLRVDNRKAFGRVAADRQTLRDNVLRSIRCQPSQRFGSVSV